MLDSATIKRFEDALASGKLRGLTKEMTAEGLSQVAIYCLFESFSDFLSDTHREADADCIGNCMDCIVGFISPASKWFPDHYLTNEEICEYQKTNA